jgi:DNA-binding NtrC family response regulator
MQHIYIIEDDVGILEGLTFLLEKTYRVTAISDARIALNKLQLEQPDLILLDLLMPNLNGAAFIEAFSKQALKVPILIMSACSNVNVQLHYPTVAGLIRKPFQIEEIVTTIERVIADKNRIK